MKRFNQYLLTHFPLLWNTNAAWALLANVILHLLFFLGGLGSVTAKTLVNHYSVSRVGGASLYTFSVLCALLVMIVWCVFYLRNNAFKRFYRIAKFYLAKEFAIVFLILLTTVSYPQSFEWGVKLKVRSITNEKRFVYEVTAVNKGMVYVPLTKTAYFLLNDCAEKAKRSSIPETDITPPEPGQYYGGADSFWVKRALARPNAFSYANYCRKLIDYTTYPTESAGTVSVRNKQWLANGQRDSVKQSLRQLFSVLNKYGIDYRLDADELTDAVFKDSLSALSALIPTERFDYRFGERENRFYLSGDAVRLLNFIEECQPNADNGREVKTTWNVFGHVSLALSVLLLCYRRFSRKVFLISAVGTLVWMILTGLIVAGSYGSTDGAPALLLFLCVGFLLTALGLLNGRSSKTTAGVLLNWHVYLLPFAAMLTAALVHSYHSRQLYGRFSNSVNTESLMQQYYPFSTWVVNHEADIFLANIPVAACYVAFVFNGLAKRWHLLPEE